MVKKKKKKEKSGSGILTLSVLRQCFCARAVLMRSM